MLLRRGCLVWAMKRRDGISNKILIRMIIVEMVVALYYHWMMVSIFLK